MLSTITKTAISISKIYLAVMVTAFVDMNSYYEPLALLTAIIFGSITGLSTKIHADIADYSIVVMLSCLFFNVSMGDLLRGANNKLYLITAWLVNFVALPTMASVHS